MAPLQHAGISQTVDLPADGRRLGHTLYLSNPRAHLADPKRINDTSYILLRKHPAAPALTMPRSGCSHLYGSTVLHDNTTVIHLSGRIVTPKLINLPA